MTDAIASSGFAFPLDREAIARVADALPHLMWYADSDGRIEFVNQPWVEYTGFSVEMMRPGQIKGIVHPAERERAIRAWLAALREGRPYEIEYRLRRHTDGAYRWFIGRATPIRDADGCLTGWVGTATDIDEQKQATETLAFLLDAEATFAGDGSAAEVFGAFARVAVTHFADWCFVHRVLASDRMQPLAVAHRDPRRVAAVESFLQRRGPRHRPELLARLRAGPLLAPVLTGEYGIGREDDPEGRALIASLGMHSALIVPLPGSGGESQGTITLLSAESLRVFSPSDLEVVDRLGRRAARALEAADRRERERRIGDHLAQVETALQSVFTTSSSDVLETARRVARACTPAIADRVTVYFRQDPDHVRLLALHDVDERMIDPGYLLREMYPLTANDPIRTVLETGVPKVLAEIDEDALLGISRDEGYRRMLRRVGLRSSLIVPLLSAGSPKAIGALVLSICRDNPRRFGNEDLPLTQEVAARISLALETAARYEREHRVSQTFQRAALSTDLPHIPGTSLSAWYEAGGNEALIGGDWYDAFRLLDGRLVISIGDVAGSGLDAAVIMGSIRQSIRTAAIINPNPRLALDAVDRVVRALGERYVTACVGIFDPLTGELRYASAGHPPPLLRTPDGRIEPLGSATGLPLGLRNLAHGETTMVTLDPGSQVLFHTDGLTELDHDLLAGEARLREAFAQAPVVSARRLFERVLDGRQARDDVALLLLTFERTLFDVESPRRAAGWRFAAPNARAGTAVRRKVRRFLDDLGLAPHELSQAEIVCGELIGNAVRHAGGIVDVYVDGSMGMPVVHVLDEGPGWELNPRLPADLMSERGRGLFIVTALAEELSIARRSSGAGSHARVVLRTSR